MKKLLLLCGLSLSLFGCVRTYTGAIMVHPEKETFETLRNYRLTLMPVSNKQLVSGIDYTFTWQLTNSGFAPVRIEEWYAKETDNIRIYWQDWKPGTSEPNDAAWQLIRPVVPDRAVRFPLDLSPGISAMVTTALPFLEEIKVTPGKERRFFIKAELNLNSVRASSDVVGISVI